ncbi:hypothetical protein SAMN05421823_101187 [Catalinimonas alkaloidigena]|uniref:Uncharacterized protein n=1 Tax=Catalinimonas alkaloidigena TaxID=1075417 RepID=A0A1G8WU55_9BACT|nr:hypothetical protein SAMN05421823_101187 [Catalinimonas alkaloidigena]
MRASWLGTTDSTLKSTYYFVDTYLTMSYHHTLGRRKK